MLNISRRLEKKQKVARIDVETVLANLEGQTFFQIFLDCPILLNQVHS